MFRKNFFFWMVFLFLSERRWLLRINWDLKGRIFAKIRLNKNLPLYQKINAVELLS